MLTYAQRFDAMKEDHPLALDSEIHDILYRKSARNITDATWMLNQSYLAMADGNYANASAWLKSANNYISDAIENMRPLPEVKSAYSGMFFDHHEITDKYWKIYRRCAKYATVLDRLSKVWRYRDPALSLKFFLESVRLWKKAKIASDRSCDRLNRYPKWYVNGVLQKVD